MKTEEFLSKLDHERIVQAIRDAEARSSGEIRMYVHRGDLKEDPVAAGQKEFLRLGINKTQERNGVLIFLAPHAQEFAVIGDEEIHRRCGEQLWQEVANKMSEHFANQRFSEAIVDAIEHLGGVLANHFPRKTANPNELPDDVIEQ